MTAISRTEENYLKTIFQLCEQSGDPAATNAIAQAISTSAASVTDMVKKLSKKDLILYQKHKGVRLTETGNQIATSLIRKHRLWETFLVKKLNFSWEEVHEIAEELEHIPSNKLIDRLDDFLGYPKFDPHGDAIPDVHGNFAFRKQVSLLSLAIGEEGILVSVQDDDVLFLQYLNKMQLLLGAKLKVLERFEYDGSIRILLNMEQEHILTKKVCLNLFVKTNYENT